MIASGLPNFIRIVCWKFFLISLLRRHVMYFLIIKQVFGPMSRQRAFATLQIELYRVVGL